MSLVRAKFMSEDDNDRLHRIINAARRQLETLGLDGITIRGLAAESKVSPATLYRRFGSKDNVISLVIIDNFELFVDSHRRSARKSVKPLENLITLLDLEVISILSRQSLVRALVGMYYKQGSDRELPNHLRKMISDRIQEVLVEMQEATLINSWVKPALLSVELADRILAVVMRWSQKEFRDDELLERILFSVLSSLAAFSEGTQSKDIDAKLRKINSHID